MFIQPPDFKGTTLSMTWNYTGIQQLKRKFELYNNVTPLSIKPFERNVSDKEKSKMVLPTDHV